MLLFNANLDRSAQTRKSLKELRKEIQKWEEAIYMKKTIVDDAGEYMVFIYLSTLLYQLEQMN